MFNTMDELIERIRQVDEDDELYMSILRANPLRNPEFMDLICRFKQAKQDYILRLAECVFETQASRFEEYTKDELRKQGNTGKCLTVQSGSAAIRICPRLISVLIFTHRFARKQ